MFEVDFNTGAGNEECTTIEEAIEAANEGACYTQRDIDIIEIETGKTVATRKWYGVEPSEDDREQDIIEIGGGFYADWWFLAITNT